MSLRNLSYLLFACLIFVSCKEDKLEQYEGIWDGSFAGDEAGTLKIRIKEDGVSEGVAYPAEAEGDQSFIFKGSVNEDGELLMTANVFGRDAEYRAFLSETNFTGTWSAQNEDFTGTWTGTKREQEDNFPYGLILYP